MKIKLDKLDSIKYICKLYKMVFFCRSGFFAGGFFLPEGAFCLRGVLARGGFWQEGGFGRRGVLAGGGFCPEGVLSCSLC